MIRELLTQHQKKQHEKAQVSRSSMSQKHERDLIKLIPQLLAAFKGFITFHMERRQKATEKVQEHEARLAEHVRLYMDDAPTERKELETKVAEMRNIVGKSEKMLYESAKMQVTLWGPQLHLLPEGVREVLVKNLLQLKQSLPPGNSPMTQLLVKCETLVNDKIAREEKARAQAKAQAQAQAQARARAQAQVNPQAQANPQAAATQQQRGQKPKQQQQQQQQQQRAQPPPPPPQAVQLLPVGTHVFTRFTENHEFCWYEG